MTSVEEVVHRWKLQPHPEGGWFRETYRSPLTAELPGWPRRRNLATSILYLLPPGGRSAWHRVQGDELWLWHGGAPMRLLTSGSERPRARDEDATLQLVGPDADAGQLLQALVPGGHWQSATPAGDAWSLVGCIVAPGFDFADFELA